MTDQTERAERKELVERLSLYAPTHLRAEFIAAVTGKPTWTLRAMLESERRKCVERNRTEARAAVKRHNEKRRPRK